MESLGAQLKQAREQRGVGLDEIAQTTKIGTRFLRAMEADRYDQLPGGIFNKGFIRAYARAVGLDEEKAVAEYVAATEPGPAKTEAVAQVQSHPVELRAEAESPAADLPWGVFAIILVLVALGLAGWGFYSQQSRTTAKSPAQQAVSASASPASTGAAQSSSPHVESHAPSPGLTASQKSTSTSTGNEGQRATETKPDNSKPPVTPVGYFGVRVNVREDSWLSIAADGKTVLQGRFLAPAQKSVKARNQIVVQTGNAGGLDFEFNGHVLPRQGEPDEGKTLIFGVDGLEAVQSTAQPGARQP